MRNCIVLLLTILAVWILAMTSDFHTDVHVEKASRLTLEQQEAVVARW